jgi:hypothetical protein
VWKKDSCAGTSSTSASASPSGVEVPSDREGLATGAGSGGLFDIESGGLLVLFQRAGQSRNCILRFALLGADGLFTNVASSNGLHLKFFLYPPQMTLLLWHCWHDGFVSSHFNLFALHVIHPESASVPLSRILVAARRIRDSCSPSTYHFCSWIVWALQLHSASWED